MEKNNENFLKAFYKKYILTKKHLILLLSILVFSLISSILQILIPYFLKGIMDFAIAGKKNLMYNAIWLFGIAWILAVISAYIYGYCMEIIKVDVKGVLRKNLLRKLHTLLYSEVNKHTQGAYLQIILDDVDKIDPLIIDSYLNLGTMGFMALGALILMIKMSWILTIVSVLPVPLYMVLMVIYQKKAISLTQKRQKDYQNVIAFIDESIGNTYIVRNFGILHQILDLFTTFYNKYVKSYMDLFRVNFFYSSVLNTFLSIGVQFFIILFGAILILKGKLTAGIVLSFMIYVEYVRQPLDYILRFSTQVEPAKVSLKRIFQILNRESVYEPKTHSLSYLKRLPSDVPAVEIKNLSFSYENHPVINNLSLTLKQGKWLCIIGESGRGKSTLLNILMKHYSVPDGKVFLLGEDINKMEVNDILSLITLIEQEPQFFSSMSIYENLTLGQDIPWEKVEEIAAKIGLKNLLNKISKNRKILLKNSGLSGGEKKRLSLLRGMLRNTPIVIIDEPTAFLDKDNAIRIMSKLKEFLKGKTVIITTHDEKILKLCDEKIFIE